jgi:hypothetical protein
MVIPNCAHDDEYGTHGNVETLLKLQKIFSEFGGHIFTAIFASAKCPAHFLHFFLW